jgi:hypothetical protein
MFTHIAGGRDASIFRVGVRCGVGICSKTEVVLPEVSMETEKKVGNLRILSMN